MVDEDVDEPVDELVDAVNQTTRNSNMIISLNLMN